MKDSFQDTNIVAYSRSFAVVDVIGVAADAFAFVAVYDQSNVAVSDPMVLELVDLSLLYQERKSKIPKISEKLIKKIVL